MMQRIKGIFVALFEEGRGESKTERILSYLTWAAIVATMIGSIMSILGICTGGCSDAEKYRFFGLPFGAVGLPFFILLGTASLVRNSKRPLFRSLYDVMLPGVAGAEWIFLGFQSRVIKSYCPVCVAIAVAVFVAVVVRLVEVYLRNKATRPQGKKSIRAAALSFGKTLLVIGSVYAGLLMALVGTSSPVVAGSGVITHDIWLGKANSPVEVLVVSDWYCPYCRQVEPVLDSALPDLSKAARYTFIDDPIHSQSLAFLPAHMSLLVGSKANYMAGRKVLLNLAVEKKVVKQEEIMAALKTKGINLTLLPEEELKRLASSEAGFLVANSVTMTPTVVIRNSKTGIRKQLVGVEQITRDQILAAVSELGR